MFHLLNDLYTYTFFHAHHTYTRPAIETQPHTFWGLTSLAKQTTRTHWATLLSARGHAQRTCRLLLQLLQKEPLFLRMS